MLGVKKEVIKQGGLIFISNDSEKNCSKYNANNSIDKQDFSLSLEMTALKYFDY
ncbi:hypothetical protein MUGA111182_09590 [Mucilaginibacter galii]|uniref:Uncharacterized protein n=1 Tax=Mucilaginibacter galii TaxID=2005073 RepID=A0A917J8R6_9SPHI|nr:hypothetical protein GCM10011425_24320 [Mucilaginibacter galii]